MNRKDLVVISFVWSFVQTAVIGCPPGVHLYTNCTNPCRTSDDLVYCEAEPNSVCKPDYCGGCVPRFYDVTTKKEVHCEKEAGIVCEMKSHTFGCYETRDKVIRIGWANYGRTSASTCRHPFGTEQLHGDLNCRADNSIEVVKMACQGKRQCQLTVDNKLFTKDPCHGVYKYLEFDFDCVSPKILSQDISSGNHMTTSAIISVVALVFAFFNC